MEIKLFAHVFSYGGYTCPAGLQKDIIINLSKLPTDDFKTLTEYLMAQYTSLDTTNFNATLDTIQREKQPFLLKATVNITSSNNQVKLFKSKLDEENFDKKIKKFTTDSLSELCSLNEHLVPDTTISLALNMFFPQREQRISSSFEDPETIEKTLGALWIKLAPRLGRGSKYPICRVLVGTDKSKRLTSLASKISPENYSSLFMGRKSLSALAGKISTRSLLLTTRLRKHEKVVCVEYSSKPFSGNHLFCDLAWTIMDFFKLRSYEERSELSRVKDCSNKFFNQIISHIVAHHKMRRILEVYIGYDWIHKLIDLCQGECLLESVTRLKTAQIIFLSQQSQGRQDSINLIQKDLSAALFTHDVLESFRALLFYYYSFRGSLQKRSVPSSATARGRKNVGSTLFLPSLSNSRVGPQNSGVVGGPAKTLKGLRRSPSSSNLRG